MDITRGGIMGVDTMHSGAAALRPGIAASAGGPAAYSHSAGQRGPLLKIGAALSSTGFTTCRNQGMNQVGKILKKNEEK